MRGKEESRGYMDTELANGQVAKANGKCNRE